MTGKLIVALLGLVIAATMLMGFDQYSDLSEADVESFFRRHTVDGNQSPATFRPVMAPG